VGAGVEAGPEGEDLMAENSSLYYSLFICHSFVIFFTFFFTCLWLISVPTDGRFLFFFFTKHRKKYEVFWASRKKQT
jgi:hypothetical protein